ncbi:transporter [Muriicola sp.]|uniref:transporter n=1 Tax=Muriicola sp. TaxID=2020856 RepID=UPI003C763B9D
MIPPNNFGRIRFGCGHFVSSFLILISSLCSTVSNAQDIEPRRWTNLPIGIAAIGIGYGYTFGDVYFDPLLQAEDAVVTAHTIITSYVKPFRIGKKLARIDVALPFSSATWEGLLRGEPASVKRTGLLDPKLRFSYHLIGPPAMAPKELQEYLAEHTTYTTLGVSLAINLPLGQYDEDKLINLGLNQFIFRPQLGVSHNWGPWSVEWDASVYFYTKNNNFFNDGTKRLKPLVATQAHLIKRFKSGAWASISTGYGIGGTSRVNRLSNDDKRSNILGSASLGFAMGKRQSAKMVYFHSQTLMDIGSNTNSLLLVWSMVIQ